MWVFVSVKRSAPNRGYAGLIRFGIKISNLFVLKRVVSRFIGRQLKRKSTSSWNGIYAHEMPDLNDDDDGGGGQGDDHAHHLSSCVHIISRVFTSFARTRSDRQLDRW